MSRNEYIGVGAIVALFIGLLLVLVWSFGGGSPSSKAAEDSFFVQQRMKNIEKGR